ncbi:hypothetical protein RHGRI_018870 [Rhododendron griersonianum]|uniref:RING-type domain-containing protein n=1 Tax=Rhododendron griersonianum TaxID=479676 RepID=A0AAV6K314_9ERIC|nr:hypothetical protein RHGRI_018870 [Rhododendron griersonianum]
MAVEARHLNIFPSQIIGNREMMNGTENNVINAYNNLIGYGLPPLSGTTTETLLPLYNTNNSAMKSDSGLSYPIPSVSRKRTRDSINPLLSFPNGQIYNQSNNRCSSFTFLGEDVSLQIHQQQLEIDRFIAQHTVKVRLDMEERRKRYSRRIIAAVEEGVVKRLRAKEEEIDKIGKLNWALEERVKSLFIENQIWRDLAQSNEATANALRTNLEQVLAHVNDEQQNLAGALDQAQPARADMTDDAESCCGSNYEDKGSVECGGGGGGGSGNERLCRKCEKVESCVLLLPCRHLCLCAVCGSSVHACPVCNAVKNASLHVIMPS